MTIMNPQQVLRQLVAMARAWRARRQELLRLHRLVKGRRPEELETRLRADYERAQRVAGEAAEKLDEAVERFERVLSRLRPKPGRPFPWKAFLGAVSSIAGAIERGIDDPDGNRELTPRGKIIDVTADPS